MKNYEKKYLKYKKKYIFQKNSMCGGIVEGYDYDLREMSNQPLFINKTSNKYYYFIKEAQIYINTAMEYDFFNKFFKLIVKVTSPNDPVVSLSKLTEFPKIDPKPEFDLHVTLNQIFEKLHVLIKSDISNSSYAVRIFLTKDEYDSIIDLINKFKDEKYYNKFINIINEMYKDTTNEPNIPDTIKKNYAKVLYSDCSYPFSNEEEKKQSFKKLTNETYNLLPEEIKKLYRKCMFSFYPWCIK